jgi:23S rRNA pseudouridine1911/1915/1917 synthase
MNERQHNQAVNSTIKLSSPSTQEFWEIAVLFEDEHLLALDKPSGLPTAPDPETPERPSLMQLLHDGIASGRPWAVERGLSFLRPANQLDTDTTGVLLLAKSMPVWVKLVDVFGAGKPGRRYLALVQGVSDEDRFEVDAKLAPSPTRLGLMKIDAKRGKRSHTVIEVVERFSRHLLLRCTGSTDRPYQIRLHVRHVGMAIVGDPLYRGKPLYLSQLKPDYRLKEGKVERPLLGRAAVHAEALEFAHPISGEPVTITAPEPKDFRVALKYLRLFP